MSDKLLCFWSPEQIAGRLRSGLDGKSFTLSFSSIYRWLASGLLPRSVQLRRSLRHDGQRHGETRGAKVGARELRTRCRDALKRKRCGDWEADTIVFGNTSDRRYLLSLADRKSRYCCLLLLRNVKKPEMFRAFTVFFGEGKLPLETMTSDRGVEFNCHKEFEELFHKDYYYTRPASPWQKPTVENMNGLVRQFFPSGTSGDELNDDAVERVMILLNNRHRKTLAWKTPAEALRFT